MQIDMQLILSGLAVQTAAGNHQAFNSSGVVVNKTVGAATQVTLEDCSNKAMPLMYMVVDGKGDAATNNITIVTYGAQTINGASSYVINTNYGGVVLLGANGAWTVVANVTDSSGGAGNFASINGTASTFPIKGLSAAQGGSITLQGGTSSTSANAGGAASVLGGSPGATGVGGAANFTSGPGGSTSGASGVTTVSSGTASNGTSGANSGAVNVLSGAPGNATSGTGGTPGTVTIGGTAGGSATTGTGGPGGPVVVAGGSGGGTSAGTGNGGAGGNATINAGPGGSSFGGSAGANGLVLIGDSNTAGTYINRSPKTAVFFGITTTSIGTSQSSSPTAAQLLGGKITQTGQTAGGAINLPTGTAISAACPRAPVLGDSFECTFANLGGGQTLTVTSATGSTVESGGAIASGHSANLVFTNTGANAWAVDVIGG